MLPLGGSSHVNQSGSSAECEVTEGSSGAKAEGERRERRWEKVRMARGARGGSDVRVRKRRRWRCRLRG